MLDVMSSYTNGDDRRACPQNMQMKEIGALIRDGRKRKGWSLEELGTRMGVSRSAANQWELGKTVPETERIPTLATLLDLDLSEMMGAPPPQESDVIPAHDAPPRPQGGELANDVPVMGNAVGGDSGDFEMNGTTAFFAPRPNHLRGRQDVFAVLVQNDSMSPWREPGSLAYAEGRKPPRTGEYVIIEMKAGRADPVRVALLKKLIASTPTKYRFLQFNPRREFEIDRDKVFRLYRVIDADELLGV